MAYSALKRLLIGRPLSTREFEHQRLPGGSPWGLLDGRDASTALRPRRSSSCSCEAGHGGLATVPISLFVVALW